jgi:hypothetical protein
MSRQTVYINETLCLIDPDATSVGEEPFDV